LPNAALSPPPLSPVLTHDRFLGVRHFGSLDGFRCLCILAVITQHVAGSAIAGYPITTRGFLGVDMFFVISGFLIVTLLLRERAKTGVISLKNFYIRRSLRIFPVYYGLFAVLIVVFAMRRESVHRADFFHDLPYLLTYTADWVAMKSFMGIGWSLAAEEQFYLLWPPVEQYCKKWAMLVVMPLFLILNQLLNFGFFRDQIPGLIAIYTFTPICLGVILAHLLHNPRTFPVLAAALGRPFAPLIYLAVLIVLCCLPYETRGFLRLAIQLTMAALLGSCVIREDNLFAPFLRLKLIARMGVVSYGLYLFHMLCLIAIGSVLTRLDISRPILLFLLTTVVSYVVAEISFRFYEQPFLRLKNRFGDQHPTTASPV
jgi:peptidoglycan/LPS O-acetylase OafA/YrhL